MRSILFALYLCVFLSACATHVSNTNRLAPGMTPAQVQGILGQPAQTQFVGNAWVWKYSLLQPFQGYMPFYLLFDREGQTLQAWAANEAEYHRNQQLMLDQLNQANAMFPPKQKHEITIKHKHR